MRTLAGCLYPFLLNINDRSSKMKTETISNPAKTNETLKTIYERRAVRKYRDEPVKRELIEKLLDAGRMAPSAMNTQAWKFYVLTQKETIRAFSKEIVKLTSKDFLKGGIKKAIINVVHLLRFSHGIDFSKMADPVFYGAPVVIFITAPKDYEWADLDIGMCSQNIMLAAKALGLDTCPVGFGKYAEHVSLYPKLHIPASEKLCFSITVGYGKENPEVQERKKENVVFID